ncbi:unnamed protein product [Cyclocybe aegerita]|uniref:Uncharacterized protein n=1 Tax=Cyclocybe aegerita TaxID=1973307 RepID=A0A8S0X8N3_CYCAE|nr:unnamed protein product [Cyclocybe aegerita]
MPVIPGLALNPASDQDIAQARAYEAVVIFACMPNAAAAPPWLVALQANIQAIQANTQNMATNIDLLLQCSAESPILLENSSMGNKEALYDPRQPGCQVHLAPPHPTTRDELLRFTCEW